MPELTDKEKEHFKEKYMDKLNTKGKFTTTKGQLYYTAILFLFSLLFVAYMYISKNITDSYDIAALVTMITVTGAIFGSNLVWYSKKSASEKHYELRIALFHDSARVRLNYNEAMIKMMKKYKVTQADIDRIDETGDMDEMMNNAMQSTVSDLDTVRDDADSKNEIETFNSL